MTMNGNNPVNISTRDKRLLENAFPNKNELENAVTRVINGEPLQYVLGKWEFMSLDFIVSPSVLIPRSDTETLAEAALNLLPQNGGKVLDICTGSGCILISLLHYSKQSSGIGIDINTSALNTASENAILNNVQEKATFIHCDALQPLLFDADSFDIIVSNPPYIRTEILTSLDPSVINYEPHLALDGGLDGLTFYKAIAKNAKNLLKPGGTLLFEIGFDQRDAVLNIMQNCGYSSINCKKDLTGNDRVVTGVNS